MKKILLVNLSFIVILLFSSSYSNAPQVEKNTVLLKAILQGLERNHFLDMQIDDDFSAAAFDLYLKRIDGSKRFLIQSDYDQLKEFRLSIDDEITNGTYNLFDMASQKVASRINESEVMFQIILSKPFDFSISEEINLDSKSLEYVKNEEELHERWRILLKYQTLAKLNDELTKQETALEKNDTTIKQKPFEVLEKEARKDVLKTYTDWFKRVSKTEVSDRRSTYLNVLANIFDPHTGFYPPKDKKDFDIKMSGRLEGIGASLQQKDGYIEVAKIVAGSACWKQGELEVGDLIVKVGQAEEEPVDVVDMRLDKAVQLIRGPKGTEVRLTVKKADGQTKIIPIIRDVVILEETYAKSAMLNKGKGYSNVGYIKLPKFYADFQKKDGRNCSDDIKKELEKLIEDNVEGIIIDLRNNGGGSLNDVVKMMGFFIDEGPVVQIKSRMGSPMVMSDREPGVIYDGPLVVLVNKNSASASEILAAAVQDYQRGIIIGSNSTFGKGTVQRFFNLDKMVKKGFDEVKPLGSIKLTTQKFYRVNGGATQLKGVIPDVIVPDSYSYIQTGEKKRDHSMKWDEIEPASYEKLDENTKSFTKIIKRSQSRIDGNASFNLVDENAQRIKNRQSDKTYSLVLEEFRAEIKTRREEGKKYKKLFDADENMVVSILSGDMETIESDTTKLTRFKNWEKGIKKDPYIQEAINVIKEL